MREEPLTTEEIEQMKAEVQAGVDVEGLTASQTIGAASNDAVTTARTAWKLADAMLQEEPKP